MNFAPGATLMPSPMLTRVPLSLALLLLPAMTATARDDEEDSRPDRTRPGLVARVEPADPSRAGAVVRVEPIPRLFGREGDSPHPKIAADRFRVRWEGLLVVAREGQYTFTASRSSLAGFKLSVGGKSATLGGPIALEAGNLPLVIEGTQRGGEPSFELWWRSADFADEPIPPRAFRHDAEIANPEILAAQGVEDRGAVLSETLGCFRCHEGPEGWTRSLAGDPAARASLLPGPTLDGVGTRLRKTWVLDLLTKSHRAPGTRMPVLFGEGPGEALAARAIAAYLTRAEAPTATPRASDAKKGEATYQEVGVRRLPRIEPGSRGGRRRTRQPRPGPGQPGLEMDGRRPVRLPARAARHQGPRPDARLRPFRPPGRRPGRLPAVRRPRGQGPRHRCPGTDPRE